MAWFKREKKSIEQPTPPEERRVRTEGLWTKCENCRTTVWKKDLEANWRVCPKCQHHFRLNATQRLELLLDSRWVEYDAALASSDPLHFTDTRPYAARLKDARRKLGMADAVRYVQLYHQGAGDYTRERHEWLDDLSHDQIANLMAKTKKGARKRKRGNVQKAGG